MFSDKNVTVSDGKLHLTMRKEKLPAGSRKAGVQGLHQCRPAHQGQVWLRLLRGQGQADELRWVQFILVLQDETPGWGTEIDVFEIGGKAKGFEHKYNMTLHVTPRRRRRRSTGASAASGKHRGDWPMTTTSTDLDWGKDEMKFYVDGVLVRSVENTHWHQPLFLIFDSETMPQWFGMPDDNDLPSTFSVEYVRAWKQKQ